MRPRRTQIPLRKVIFVGCEGQSECGYGGLLQDLANAHGLWVHIKVEDLHPAGDPLARVQCAVQRLAHIGRTKGAIRDRFILLDQDQARRDPQRAEQAIRLAGDHSIDLIWQDPNIEAVLLRHLEGHATRRPPDAKSAFQALRGEWAEYEKPMSRAALAARLHLDEVLRAGSVEADLRRLLRCIGFEL